MSRAPIWLMSSHQITHEELKEMVLEAGGVLTPDRPFMARVSQGENHVWVYGVEEIDPADPGWEDDQDALQAAQLLLGEMPRSSTVLFMSYGSGSPRVALKFAKICAQHWPCVLESFDNTKFFTKEEIEQLEQEGNWQ